MSTNLWMFDETDEQGLGAAGDMYSGSAPKIKPIDGVIDVVSDFPWTHTLQNQTADVDPRKTVPVIELVEYTITQTSMINQMVNNFAAAGESIPGGNEIMGLISTETEGGEVDDLLATITGVGGSAKIEAEPGANTQNSMFPYSNLYQKQPTDFRYLFPYFKSATKSITNSFTQNNQADDGMADGGVAGSLMEAGMDLSTGAASMVAKTANALEPGSYIEQSKFFSFAGRENSYNFEFPLNNCDQHEDIARNWQLLYLLTYQNLPNRMSRDLIMPPCVYTAHIPGVWYSPYAYINNLNIDYIGTRRRMEIEVPIYSEGDASASKKVEVIIPDAYVVKISMSELVGEAQNMMYHMINQTIRTS